MAAIFRPSRFTALEDHMKRALTVVFVLTLGCMAWAQAPQGAPAGQQQGAPAQGAAAGQAGQSAEEVAVEVRSHLEFLVLRRALSRSNPENPSCYRGRRRPARPPSTMALALFRFEEQSRSRPRPQRPTRSRGRGRNAYRDRDCRRDNSRCACCGRCASAECQAHRAH